MVTDNNSDIYTKLPPTKSYNNLTRGGSSVKFRPGNLKSNSSYNVELSKEAYQTEPRSDALIRITAKH